MNSLILALVLWWKVLWHGDDDDWPDAAPA